ncbi:MAG: hypothetical protein Q9227_002997 [Pyrenula ochraceoflavens]
MKIHAPHQRSTTFTLLLCLVLSSSLTLAARKTNPDKIPKNAVLLSNIETLTLRSGKQTAHRRVSSVPQTNCVGPSNVCALYTVDVLRCKNEGADYDPDNVQWTCTASLPAEFKLGGTDVTCEGYESSEDPFVLKGSCGVEYRLLLTEKGEEKYGRKKGGGGGGGGGGGEPLLTSSSGKWETVFVKSLFWMLFIGILIMIIRGIIRGVGELGQTTNRGGSSWGGGGGGGGDGHDDPPPPYDWQPPRKPRSRPASTSTSSGRRTSQHRYQPGFWTGAAGGAAAGYAAGNYAARRNPSPEQPRRSSNWNFNVGGGNDAGEGSSRSPPSFSSSRYESTGFGSSSRR